MLIIASLSLSRSDAIVSKTAFLVAMDNKVFIYFDGAYRNSTVYINGEKVGFMGICVALMQPPDQLHQDAAPIGQMRLVSLDLAVRVLPSSLECNYVTELAVVWA